jgi:hypothetical protein
MAKKSITGIVMPDQEAFLEGCVSRRFISKTSFNLLQDVHFMSPFTENRSAHSQADARTMDLASGPTALRQSFDMSTAENGAPISLPCSPHPWPRPASDG